MSTKIDLLFLALILKFWANFIDILKMFFKDRNNFRWCNKLFMSKGFRLSEIL